MRQLILILCVSFVFCSILATRTSVFACDSEAYEKINTIFASKIDLIQGNDSAFELAIELLHEEESKQEASRDHEQTKIFSNLVALGNLKEDSASSLMESCSWNGYEIVRKNFDCLNSNLRPDGKARIIDEIIYQKALSRAEACRPIYVQLYRRASQKVPANILEQLDVLMSEVIEQHAPSIELNRARLAEDRLLLLHSTQQLYSQFIVRSEAIGGPDDVEAVYSAFETLLQDVTISENENSVRVDDTFEKYLRNSCSNYVSAVTLDLFQSARFDSLFWPENLWNEEEVEEELEKGKQVRGADSSMLEFEFYLGWAKQKLCQNLLSDPNRFKLEMNVKHVYSKWPQTNENLTR